MDKFCKVYETEEYGQIVVQLDESQEGEPEVKLSFRTPLGGVSSVRIGFEDTDDGWFDRGIMFDNYTELMSKLIVEAVFEDFDLLGV